MTARQRATHAFRTAVASALYYSGLLRLLQHVVLRRKAIVLMYHRVLTPDERQRTGSHPGLVVDCDVFARHMALLRRHFRVLTIEEFADRIDQRRPFENSSCLITFDDGWNDNFTNAFPVLRKQRLPGLVFLPVNYIGSRRVFWQEALVHLLMRAADQARRDPDRRDRLRELLAPVFLDHLVQPGYEHPREAVLRAIGTLKRHQRTTIEPLVEALAGAVGVRLEDLASIDGFMSWLQIDDMARDGISFGAHGAEHLLLTEVGPEDVRREMLESRSVISQRVREWTPVFSYPNGYWTPEIAATARATGYRLAFITRRGFVSCDDDPFTICRLNVHESMTSSTPMFLARVLGVL